MTLNQAQAQTEFEDDLPEVITLRSGARFAPRDNYWRFLDGVRSIYIDFDSLPSQVEALKQSLKRVLIDILQRNSSVYASNMFYNFRRLASVVAEQGETVERIETVHLLNFIAKCGTSDRLGLESQVAALLNRWSALGLEGVSDEAVRFLTSRRKKGNIKGEAVVTLDPVQGPLSDLEFEELMSAVTHAYAENVIEEKLFLLAWLVALTGQRTCQYCSLKVKDVRRVESEHRTEYQIDIPRAKQRDALLRDAFLMRPLPEQIGKALWEYAQDVARFHSELGEDAPLFPTTSVANEDMQLNDEFRHHPDVVALGAYIRQGLRRIAPISMRTGEPIHIGIGRFRDTLGTRAAQEGYGELVIAELLGHADTQNVKCYVAVIPEIAQRLDKQLAKELAPIANAFKGRILIDKDAASRAGDPTSDIVDYANAGKTVGSCGTRYDCKFNAPIACYTCHNFEAWLDAPHEALLEHLLAERERLLVSSGPRVASINDRTIMAIQSVVDACQQIGQGEAESVGALNG